MNSYRIKFAAPTVSDYVVVDGYNMSDAACSLLFKQMHRGLFIRPKYANRTDGLTTYYCLVEVEHYGELLVRNFAGGITRSGKLKPYFPNERLSLDTIAAGLLRLIKDNAEQHGQALLSFTRT